MSTNAQQLPRAPRPREMPGRTWTMTFAIAVGSALPLIAWGLGTLAA